MKTKSFRPALTTSFRLALWGGLFLLAAGGSWAMTPDEFEDGALPYWTVPSLNAALTQVGTDTWGDCSSIVPFSGTHQARWSCPSCSPGEMVTLRYTPPETGASPYIVADIHSCGMNRGVFMRVVDSSAQSCNVYSTSCTGGIDPQNYWDHVFVDMSLCTLSDVAYVEFITDELYGSQVMHLDHVRGQAERPPCDTGAPCVILPQGWTCTFTPTGTPTSTPTDTPTDSPTSSPTHSPTSTATSTPTSSPTPTFTPTSSETPTDTPTPTPSPTPTSTTTPTSTHTLTPTSTPWSLSVFPNPVDFLARPPQDNCCPPEMKSGCVKFFGVPEGSTLRIYTLHLALVRTFEAADIRVATRPPCLVSLDTQKAVDDVRPGWVVWGGDNDEGNPVSAGMYFWVVEPPSGDKIIGKIAVAKAKPLKP